MYTGVRVSDPLELELQTAVNCYVGFLEEQSVFLITEPSPQPPSVTFNNNRGPLQDKAFRTAHAAPSPPGGWPWKWKLA